MRSGSVPGTGEAEDTPLLPLKMGSISKLSINQFLIYLVGLSEGLTHLAALAIYYLLKDDLGLTPPQVSAIFIVPSIPWILKPCFAFCSDSYPLFGYRRKSYMLLFSMLEALGFAMLGLSFIPGVLGPIICLSIISLSAAFCSCVAEALVVQTAQGKTKKGAAGTVIDFIGSKAVGSLMVAYFSGYLLERTSKSSIFLTTALFPLIITAVSFFMDDPAEKLIRNARSQMSTLLEFIQRPIIWGPAIYIFIFMIGPDYDDALFFYFTNKLGFSPTFMGTLRFTYGVAAILGILIYKHFFSSTEYKTILMWTLIASFPIYISPILLVSGFNKAIGISNKMFVLSGGFLIEGTAEVQMLPLLVLITSICPPGLEATVYGFMMSVRSLGGGLSRGISALATYSMGITATNFSHLSLYILMCGLCLLLPLAVLRWVRREVSAHSDEGNKKYLRFRTMVKCRNKRKPVRPKEVAKRNKLFMILPHIRHVFHVLFVYLTYVCRFSYHVSTNLPRTFPLLFGGSLTL